MKIYEELGDINRFLILKINVLNSGLSKEDLEVLLDNLIKITKKIKKLEIENEQRNNNL